MNGPVTGTDVFIPMDMIIGGQTRLGFGWNMLMVRRGDERNRTIEHTIYSDWIYLCLFREVNLESSDHLILQSLTPLRTASQRVGPCHSLRAL